MYFYELHEGDDDLFSDLLLARETEMEPDVFFEIVQSIRRRVQDTFEHDTLIEAIAEELERDHDFIFVSDRRLTAAVNVSVNEDENYLADLEAPDDETEPDEEDEDEEADELPDFRGVFVDFDRDAGGRPH